MAWSRRDALRAGLATAGMAVCAPLFGGCAPPELRDPRPWAWVGGLRDTAVTVKARVLEGQVPLRLSLDPDLESFIELPPATTGESGVLGWELTELERGTTYHFSAGSSRGSFTTRDTRTGSHRVAFASCADTGSDHPVFDAIRERGPLFFLHMGDLHYRDIGRDDRNRFLRAYDEALSTPAQSRFFSNLPVEYVWDDHDFGPNDSNRESEGKPAASSAFRECVPHHPLALEGEDAPIARAFTVGRVRYIITDCRSARSPRSADEETMLGARQLTWFLNELDQSSRTHALVIWVSSVPWIADGGDTWGGYAAERRVLSDHIVQRGISNLAMLSGDAHMLAIDDGEHNRFSSGGEGPGFPIFQAAALDRPGSRKGGPYTMGPITGGGHFGEMDVEDPGAGPVAVTWRARDALGRVYFEHRFSPAIP